MGGLGVLLWATLLVGYDTCFRRLPNWLTLPGAIIAAGWALTTSPLMLLGGIGWAGFYLLLALRSRGIGGGDVKLAIPLGIAAASEGIWGLVLANLLASLLSVAIAALGRRQAVAHGPSMVAATWLVLQLGA